MSKIDCVNCKYYNFNNFNEMDWCSRNNEETGLCGSCEREFEDLEEATQIYDNKEEECNKWYQIHLEQAVKISDLEAKLALTEKALELACKELHCELENPDNELYTKSSDEYIEYFKAKAKEMMKSE